MSKTLSLKESFKAAVHSRVFISLWIVIVLQALLLVGLVMSMGRIGAPGTPVRFDGFSTTGIFLDNGSYLLNLVAFAIIVPVINTFISLKVYSFRGRQMALTVLWITIVLMIVATIFAMALLNIGNVY